jgi:dTDP-glucose 4,6-dehydratase
MDRAHPAIKGILMKILITGTLGFIFSNFVRKVVEDYPSYQFVGVDKAVKHYNLNNMLRHPNYRFYLADIADAHTMDRIFTLEQPDIVIGGAAESFVDNSITDILPFLQTNIIGTQILVNMCLKHKTQKYVHISTDEVYGQKLSIAEEAWTEEAPLLARNPYACSKAAAELVVRAAHETHNLQFQMTRSCNVYGPRQKRENLIPHIIYSLMNNQAIHLHGNGKNFRQYLYVDDKIDAIMKIIHCGDINTVYNIGDDYHFRNIEMVNYIAEIMQTQPNIQYITDRKAHDFGYRVSASLLRSLDWQPQMCLDRGMKHTIQWYLHNQNHYD